MSKIALVAAALSLLCACSPSRSFSTKDGTVTVTDKGKDEGSVHVAGKDGTSLDINSGKPITDYPSDAPLYKGKALMDMKAEQKHSRVVAIQTPDSIEKITEFYKSELAAKGWKIDTTVSTAEMTMFAASKENRKLTVTVGADASTKLQNINQALADN